MTATHAPFAAKNGKTVSNVKTAKHERAGAISRRHMKGGEGAGMTQGRAANKQKPAVEYCCLLPQQLEVELETHTVTLSREYLTL